MDKIKKVFCIMFVSLCAVPLFADITNRGRYSDFSDSGSKLDDLFMPVGAIIAIIIGGFMIYAYITDNKKDKSTQEMGRWGCAAFTVGLFVLILLIRSYVD